MQLCSKVIHSSDCIGGVDGMAQEREADNFIAVIAVFVMVCDTVCVKLLQKPPEAI